MSYTAGPQDAGTVSVRLQLIDVDARALDLVVATYIPARDLTQRIARDAGLNPYWEDGSRRLYWLRARGRVLGDEERLQDVGVTDGELLHLLPQPPAGSSVVERDPEYPRTRGYAGAGWAAVIGSLALLLSWTAGWAVALSTVPSLLRASASSVRLVGVGVLPSIGLALLATSTGRHLWGGDGRDWKVPVTGVAIYLPLVVLATLPALALGAPLQPTVIAVGLGALAGLVGVLIGWLAWYGAVEPLRKRVLRTAEAPEQAVITVPCGVCGGPVTPEVLAECRYRCGKVFHVGCLEARESVTVGKACAICGYEPAPA